MTRDPLLPPLEIALQKAFTDASWRSEFFRLLMQADVWVPGNIANSATNEPGSMDLQHWEKQDASEVIPFFTSQQALECAAGGGQPFVVMPVRTLFEITLGKTLFLNPKLVQGKEFTPREINRLLHGDNDPLSQQQVLQGGVPLLLSAIASVPDAISRPLIELFQTRKTVKRAFICEVKEQADEQANLLLGIEAPGDILEIIQAAGSIAAEVLAENEAIDICQVTDNDPGISHFMLAHITPFYQRRWGSFLRDFQNRII